LAFLHPLEPGKIEILLPRKYANMLRIILGVLQEFPMLKSGLKSIK